MAKVKKSSDLVAAATALAEELARYESAAEGVRKLKLDSQKSLQRAGEALAQIAESDDRIKQHIARLVEAVAGARTRHEAESQAVLERALEIQRRTAVFEQLIKRYGELGSRASELASGMNEVQEAHTRGGQAATAALSRLEASLADVIDAAKALIASAGEQGFDDVARQADALRQQLLAARNKVMLLSKGLPRA